MAVNHLAFLLDVMTVAGMWPRDWNSKRARFIYLLYYKLVDVLMISYLVCKVVFTVQVKDCEKFMQNVFESLFLSVLVCQRFTINMSRVKIKRVIQMLEELKSSEFYVGKTVEKYVKFQKFISIWFASSTAYGVIQIFLNYKSSDSPCDAQDMHKFDRQKRLYIELWMPFDETLPFNYAVTDPVVVALILVSSLTIYVFSVIIPLFVLEASCHFRILARIVRRSLVTREKLPALEQVHLKDAIKYHQKILKFCKELNECFHSLVGVKLVFLALPIIVGIFSVITQKIGPAQLKAEGHFLVQIFLEFFVFCWFGEQLSYHSLLINDAICDSHWYEMDCADQKNVLVMVRRAQRPARLEVHPNFKPANLQTFIAVSHFSYSLYSVLAGISQ